jgi:hypothetical protein
MYRHEHPDHLEEARRETEMLARKELEKLTADEGETGNEGGPEAPRD